MKEIIDLLPDRKEVCLLIKNACADSFCKHVIQNHKKGFQSANTHYPSSYRNNERQVKDDKDFANQLFTRIKENLPEIIEPEGISFEEEGKWRLLELNPRMRICRYLPGQYFHKHLDGIYYKSNNVQSKLTFMVYLNGEAEFKGGKTLFFNSKESDKLLGSYTPSAGDLIIFDHNLWHSGEEVRAGEKYILRSDILYKRIGRRRIPPPIPFAEGHLGYIWKIIKNKQNIFTCGRDRKIKVWTREGICIQELEGHDNSILSLILLSNKRLVSCSRDMTIRIWQEKDGKYQLEKNLYLEGGSILSLCNLKGTSFCASSADGSIKIVDKQGRILKTFQAHEDWVWAVEEIEAGILVSIGEDGKIRIWQLLPNSLLFEKIFNFPVTALAVYKPDRSIYIGGIDGTLIHFKYDDRYQLTEIERVQYHSDKIWCIKVDEKMVVSGGEDKRVIVLSKDKLRRKTEYFHKNFVQDLLLEDNQIISVSYDGTIKCFDIKNTG